MISENVPVPPRASYDIGRQAATGDAISHQRFRDTNGICFLGDIQPHDIVFMALSLQIELSKCPAVINSR